jgi:hypothetical protein
MQIIRTWVDLKLWHLQFNIINRNTLLAAHGISGTETAISCMLLLLLAGIGVAIFTKGQVYDPGLFRPEIFALSKQRTAEVRSADSRADSPASAGGQTPSPGTGVQAPSPSGLLDDLAPQGWKPLENATHFTADTLFEKIDGRAEQYLDYKFVGLTCVSLVNAQDSKQFIDVYLYDMGQPAQAFGVFSIERTEGLPAVALGREGYRAEASYFFWKGRYYVQLLASGKGTNLAQVGLNVARTLEKRLKDDGKPLWGLQALPEKDRIPGSVQYFTVDAMSLDFMKETYIALYRRGDAQVTAFLSKQSSRDAAAKTLFSYEGHMKKHGKVVEKRETDTYTLITADMGGAFDVVFRKGSLIGGVSMVEDLSVAEKTVLDILASLRDKE